MSFIALFQAEKWRDSASCRNVVRKDHDYDKFFGMATREAKLLCVDCPVTFECLKSAVENECVDGVWGGLDPGERSVFLRNNPDINATSARERQARHLKNKRIALLRAKS